jgi:hypothetical protein
MSGQHNTLVGDMITTRSEFGVSGSQDSAGMIGTRTHTVFIRVNFRRIPPNAERPYFRSRK